VFGVKPNKTSLITEIKNSKILTLGVGNSISKSGLTHPTQNSEWKDGQLVFNETPMSEVIRMLERWHGVSIKVADPDILDYKFTARFESESIVQILDFVKMTTFIDYTVQGNKVVLKKR
jgi:ferric-dicitrate binding protein FerR (iron transport regulator)